VGRRLTSTLKEGKEVGFTKIIPRERSSPTGEKRAEKEFFFWTSEKKKRLPIRRQVPKGEAATISGRKKEKENYSTRRRYGSGEKRKIPSSNS